MIDILNNRLSFVQFTKGNIPAECGFVIPFKENGDLKFQTVFEGEESDIVSALDAELKIYLIPHDAVITDLASIVTAAFASHMTGFYSVELSDTKLVYTLFGQLFDEDLPNVLPGIGGCFRIALTYGEAIGEETPFWLSNCIQRLGAEKFSALIEYRCKEDSYGFFYCEEQSNRIRLPIYVKWPQYTDDETVYFDSNGATDVLRSVTRKEYIGDVDHLDELTHEKIKVALSHDNVFMTSDLYTGGIRKNGNYEINWPEMNDIELAPASFKAFSTPYLVRNDNCEDCGDRDDDDGGGGDPGNCVGLYLANGPEDMPNAFLGVGYNYITEYGGDLPLSIIGLVVKPSWMTIQVNGNIVEHFGIPDATGSNLIISYTLSNCAGTSSIPFSDTIHVAEGGDCENVAIIHAPLPPNAVAGEAYSHSFTLHGTAPFGIADETGPSWMAIELIGNKVWLTGTPAEGDVANEVQISFTLSNCGGYEVDYEYLINVIAGSEPPGEGTIEIENLANATIEDVTPAFFTLEDSFPLELGESTSGTHDGYNGIINVQIATPITYYLKVFINTVLFHCQPVPSSGLYSVPSHNYLASDDIKILLTNSPC